MKSHGKLLAFLAAWLTTVGVAFFLPNLEVLAADCNECYFCQGYHFAGLYSGGQLAVAYGYFNPTTGVAASQAFDGGFCNESGNNLYQAEACGGQELCGMTDTNQLIQVVPYTFLNFTCTLPQGATPEVREFSGGVAGSSQGNVGQNACYVATSGGGI